MGGAMEERNRYIHDDGVFDFHEDDHGSVFLDDNVNVDIHVPSIDSDSYVLADATMSPKEDKNNGVEDDTQILEDEQKSKTDDSLTQKEQIPLWKELLLLVIKIGLVIAVLAAIFTFIFGLHKADDTGMEPHINAGDVIVYYRLGAKYEQNAVVLVNYEGKMLAGRVIAKGGDTVDIDEKGLIVNGSYQQDKDYTFGKETTQIVDGVTFPLTVPEGQLFLLGDNRTEAIDSRMYGCIAQDHVYGEVVLQLRRHSF
ncbi:MAG: signal peptidase I [Actinomycetaceae bacterium]|nr:signal peptidase I [Actinomycetaceae bacterium]